MKVNVNRSKQKVRSTALPIVEKTNQKYHKLDNFNAPQKINKKSSYSPKIIHYRRSS